MAIQHLDPAVGDRVSGGEGRQRSSTLGGWSNEAADTTIVRYAPERKPREPRETQRTPRQRVSRAQRPLVEQLRRFWATPKGYLLVVFAVLGALALPAEGAPRELPDVVLAVVGACVVETGFVRWREGHWRFSTSALLSGLIVAFVLSPDEPWYAPLVAGALAVASKHIVRTRHGHLFNPAGFALLVMVLLFGSGESWWGALPDLAWPWALALIALGAVVVDRVNKFPLVLSFLGTYFGLFTLASFVNPATVAEMFREPFAHAVLFLALFMLTDPPTSPGPIQNQVRFGILTAVVTCLAQLFGAGQSYLLAGLLVGNFALACRMALYHRATRAA
jgi:Na+-translocating ferredoxin:NAD+ oxidoreductase RnfD subunit